MHSHGSGLRKKRKKESRTQLLARSLPIKNHCGSEPEVNRYAESLIRKVSDRERPRSGALRAVLMDPFIRSHLPVLFFSLIFFFSPVRTHHKETERIKVLMVRTGGKKKKKKRRKGGAKIER